VFIWQFSDCDLVTTKSQFLAEIYCNTAVFPLGDCGEKAIFFAIIYFYVTILGIYSLHNGGNFPAVIFWLIANSNFPTVNNWLLAIVRL